MSFAEIITVIGLAIVLACFAIMLLMLTPYRYWINLGEAFSQLINTVHAGNPNQTFSARLAHKRDSGNLGFPSWYWAALIWSFETVWPGHLDWAKGPDEE